MADAKQGKPPSEDFYNGSGQSRVMLAKPRLGGFGSSSFGSSSNKSSNTFGSVLRPPQLKPTSNPFLKVTENTEKDDSKKEKDQLVKETDQKDDEPVVPKFVPLGSANVTRSGNSVPAPAQPTTSTSSASFVFGQNLSERVVMKENVNNGESKPEEHSSSNGTSELLFTNAAASVKENNQEDASTSEGSSGSGLAAAAAEYERSHARPPPPTTNCSLTGEEDEINVLQISCRLFAWESGSWRERGRGVLRLNDAPAASGGGSRLVARIAGSLRVVLNTKLWPDMVLQRAGTKSLRITAADAQQQIKLFLIMGAPMDITQLHRALLSRVANSKRPASTSACAVNATSQQAAERLEAAASEADYLDKAERLEAATSEADYLDKAERSGTTDRRLEGHPQTTEEYESNVDGMTEQRDDKPLKRKEPADDADISPKRLCPDIVEE